MNFNNLLILLAFSLGIYTEEHTPKSWNDHYPDPTDGTTCRTTKCNKFDDGSYICKRVTPTSIDIFGNEDCSNIGVGYTCSQDVGESTSTELAYKCLTHENSLQKILGKEKEPCVDHSECELGLRCVMKEKEYWGICEANLQAASSNCYVDEDCDYGLGCHKLGVIGFETVLQDPTQNKCQKYLSLAGGDDARDKRFCASYAINSTEYKCLDITKQASLEGANELGILICTTATQCKYKQDGVDVTYTEDNTNICVCPPGNALGNRYCRLGYAHALVTKILADVLYKYIYIYIYILSIGEGRDGRSTEMQRVSMLWRGTISADRCPTNAGISNDRSGTRCRPYYIACTCTLCYAYLVF